MKIIDRIALHKLITTIFSFIITVLKIVVKNKDTNCPHTPRRKILPWRNK